MHQYKYISYGSLHVSIAGKKAKKYWSLQGCYLAQDECNCRWGIRNWFNQGLTRGAYQLNNCHNPVWYLHQMGNFVLWKSVLTIVLLTTAVIFTDKTLVLPVFKQHLLFPTSRARIGLENTVLGLEKIIIWQGYSALFLSWKHHAFTRCDVQRSCLSHHIANNITETTAGLYIEAPSIFSRVK